MGFMDCSKTQRPAGYKFLPQSCLQATARIASEKIRYHNNEDEKNNLYSEYDKIYIWRKFVMASLLHKP